MDDPSSFAATHSRSSQTGLDTDPLGSTMCAPVARQPAEWSPVGQLIIDRSMPHEMPETFARRARLSSKAILTAVALTFAALGAIAIASRETAPAVVKTFSPVSQEPTAISSGLLPVVNR
jgi:hypothetical protein